MPPIRNDASDNMEPAERAAYVLGVATERQRILDIPCMQEEERGFISWASCTVDEAYAAGKKDGANFLRREIKDALQSK